MRAPVSRNDAASTFLRSSVVGGFSSKLDSSVSPERPVRMSKRSRHERHHRLKEMYGSTSLRQNYFQKNGRLKSRPKIDFLATTNNSSDIGMFEKVEKFEKKNIGNCQFLNIMEQPFRPASASTKGYRPKMERYQNDHAQSPKMYDNQRENS